MAEIPRFAKSIGALKHENVTLIDSCPDYDLCNLAREKQYNIVNHKASDRSLFQET